MTNTIEIVIEMSKTMARMTEVMTRMTEMIEMTKKDI